MLFVMPPCNYPWTISVCAMRMCLCVGEVPVALPVEGCSLQALLSEVEREVTFEIIFRG